MIPLAIVLAQLSVLAPRLPNIVTHCSFASSLTCDSGEVATFTRSTTGQSCPNPNEDTNYTIPAINTPCFTAGYGISVEQAVTNNIVRSEAFDNAAWVAVNAPTRAAGVADSPLNGADGDTLADSIASAGATQDGVSQQYLASTSGRQIVSVWAKVASGTLAWSLCAKSGTNTCNTGNGCCTNQTATTAWARASVNTTFGATAQTGSMVIVVGNDGTPTAGTLILFGAEATLPQSIQLTGTLPYCPSTGAVATACTASQLTVPASAFNYVHGAMDLTGRAYWARPDMTTSGSVCAVWSAQGADTTHNVRRARIASDSTIYFEAYDSAAGFTSNNGTASAWVVGTAKTLSFAWGDASRTELVDGVNKLRLANDTGAPGAVPQTFYVGSNAVSANCAMFLSNLIMYRNPPGLYR